MVSGRGPLQLSGGTHKRSITACDYISKMMKEETEMGFVTPEPPGQDGGESSIYRRKSKFTHMK